MLNEKQQAENRWLWNLCTEGCEDVSLSSKTSDLHDGEIIAVWCYYFDEFGEMSGSSMGLATLVNAEKGEVYVFHRHTSYTPNEPKTVYPINIKATLGVPKRMEKKVRIYYYMVGIGKDYIASLLQFAMKRNKKTKGDEEDVQLDNDDR